MANSGRMSVLVGALALVAATAVAYHVLRVAPRWTEKPTARPALAVPRRHVAPDPVFLAFARQAQAAEAIDDPLQRCLHYPDPPGTHWNARTTAAYCALRMRKPIDVAKVQGFLANRKAHELDTLFAALLANEATADGAGRIREAFERVGFNHSDATIRGQVDDWKAKSPRSAFALAASGALYVAQGQQARGAELAWKLTPQQVQGMHDAMRLARVDLDRAVRLEPRLMEAYHGMLTIGKFTDDEDYARKARNAAFAVDPINFDMRMSMLGYEVARWGGTADESARQAQEALALSQDHPLLRVLASRPAVDVVQWRELTPMRPPALAAIDTGALGSDMGDLANMAYGQDDYMLAVVLYSEHLRFDPTKSDDLRWRAQAMLLSDQPAWATASANQAVSRYPDDDAMLLAAAMIHRKAHDLPRAIALYETILARHPNQEDAMAYLGDLYSHEGNEPGKATALSDRLIALNPDNPNGYIVRECVQADHGLPGRYETIDYFLRRWGNDPKQSEPAEHMRGWLRAHPRASVTTA